MKRRIASSAPRSNSSACATATFFAAAASQHHARMNVSQIRFGRVIMSFKSVQSFRSASRSAVWTAFGAAAISLFAANVHAGDAQEGRAVSYADLDLSQQKDARVLYARLRFAAKSACGEPDTRDLRMSWVAEMCYRETLSEAVAKVNHSAVSALHVSDKSVRVAQRRSASEPRT